MTVLPVTWAETVMLPLSLAKSVRPPLGVVTDATGVEMVRLALVSLPRLSTVEAGRDTWAQVTSPEISGAMTTEILLFSWAYWTISWPTLPETAALAAPFSTSAGGRAVV